MAELKLREDTEEDRYLPRSRWGISPWSFFVPVSSRCALAAIPTMAWGRELCADARRIQANLGQHGGTEPYPRFTAPRGSQADLPQDFRGNNFGGQ